MSDDIRRLRPASLAEGFAALGIRARPGHRQPSQPGEKYTLDCPRCAHRRHGNKGGSLHVGVDRDGLGAVFSCFNAGDCDWNAPQAFRVAGAGRSDGRGPPPRRVYRRPPTDHVRAPDAEVYEWFFRRGLTRETVDGCGVRVARVWMPQTQREETVIAFPFRRGGEILNWKYRGPNKIFRQERDAEKVVFGFDDIAGQPWHVIVEGECDKLALWQAGIRNCASVPDGAPERVKDGDPDPDDPKFSFLLNCPAFLPVAQGGCARIVLAVDADDPGAALEYELARRLGFDRIWLVRWPDGVKDANDMLRLYGPAELRRAIEEATPYPVAGEVRVDDVWGDVVRMYDEGLPPGVPLGWQAFDAVQEDTGRPLASLRPGELVILTGIPGSGKSNWWDAVMLNTAKSDDWRWAVCSLETRVPRHVATLTELYHQKPFGRGPTERQSRDELEAAGRWLRERFRFIQSDTETPSAKFILDAATDMVRKYGINGLLIDPYTEVYKERNGQRDTDMVDEFLSDVRNFGRRHNVLTCVSAHPSKPGANTPAVPGLYDISGSAHWYNKADVGFSIFRDKTDANSLVEVHVKKVRFSELGTLGVAKLEYVRAWHGYRDPDPRRRYGTTPVVAPRGRGRRERDDEAA